MIIPPKAVALVGKLGHGKTRLLNTLTGTSFPSNMGARSCTEHLQYGYSRNNEILVVDTPGFYSSDHVAKHIAAQKIALEELELSGIYIVIKNDRADLVAEAANKIMDFVGDDNLRIIVTHADGASPEDGFDQDALASALSGLLNIPVEHIAVVGKKTPANDIDNFIASTLHTPKRFTISQEQVASISSLCVANRRFNKMIDEIYTKISAASKACSDVIMAENGRRSYETDVAIVTTQSATQAMVAKDKENIFRCVEGQELITTEDKNVIYGKAGLALSLRLKAFVDSTNELLSWNVTDRLDPRNDYRKCNYCGAIFNKTEGCDGATVCGSVPSSTKRPGPRMLLAEFQISDGLWTVQYLWNGKAVLVQYILTELKRFYSPWNAARGADQGIHQKRSDAVFESGCGRNISWSTMLPVDPAMVQMLGTVELQHPGPMEKASKIEFDERLKYHEAHNKTILRGVLP